MSTNDDARPGLRKIGAVKTPTAAPTTTLRRVGQPELVEEVAPPQPPAATLETPVEPVVPAPVKKAPKPRAPAPAKSKAATKAPAKPKSKPTSKGKPPAKKAATKPKTSKAKAKDK